MEYQNKKFRRIQPLTAFTVIIAAALIVFLIGVAVWKIKGAQNTSVMLSTGEELKYVGLVDKYGRPISGTLYFANGLSAELDVDEGTLTYSDGTVYCGPLDSDYRKHGKGSITFINGDSYTGDFFEDKSIKEIYLECGTQFKILNSTYLNNINDNLKVFVDNVSTEIESILNSTNNEINVYTLDGRCIMQGVSKEDALHTLQNGVFILGNQKVMLK
jgi:hypothetical protein